MLVNTGKMVQLEKFFPQVNEVRLKPRQNTLKYI